MPASLSGVAIEDPLDLIMVQLGAGPSREAASRPVEVSAELT